MSVRTQGFGGWMWPHMKVPFAVIKTAAYKPGVVRLFLCSVLVLCSVSQMDTDQLQVLKERQILVCLVDP